MPRRAPRGEIIDARRRLERLRERDARVAPAQAPIATRTLQGA
jgi:hypothetical protein